MKNRFLNVASCLAIATAVASSADAASFSTVDWQMNNWFKPLSTSIKRAAARPVEMVSGFGANPSSSTSLQADYDKLWNYYNSDSFVKEYQEAYRAALVKRGFDPSYADKLTPTQVKASTASAFAKPNTAAPQLATQVAALASPTAAAPQQQIHTGVYPGVSAIAGLQPVGYYVGQSQIQVQAQPQLVQQELVAQQPQQFVYAQQGLVQQEFIQPSYVQANAAFAQYQNQEAQYAEAQTLGATGQQNLQVAETTATISALSSNGNNFETADFVEAPTSTVDSETFSFAARPTFQSRGYVSAKLGLNKMFDTKYSDSSNNSLTLKHKLGYGGSIAAGTYLNQFHSAMPAGLRAEAEFGIFNAAADSIIASSGGAPAPTGNRNILAGMLNLAYDAETGSNLVPYFGAGLGAAKVSTDSYSHGGVSLSASENVVLAGQIFAGMKYELSDSMSLSFGGRYLNALKAINAHSGSDWEKQSASVLEGNVGITMNF